MALVTRSEEPRAHMALVTISEPKIRLGVRVIDFVVLCLLAIIAKIRWWNIWDPPPPQMVESGKRLLSSQFFQVPDIHTNFHRPSMFRSTELAKALEIPPNSPKKSGSGPVMSITYLGLVLILPTKFHPDLSTLSVFQDFRFPPPAPPNVTRSGRDLKQEL